MELGLIGSEGLTGWKQSNKLNLYLFLSKSRSVCGIVIYFRREKYLFIFSFRQNV